MPNYISANNDWFPCAYDPKTFISQQEALKSLKAGYSFTAFKKAFTDADTECGGRWLANSHYRSFTERGS